MSPLAFRKLISTAQLLSPPSFELDTEEIEFRQDPLTGLWCRINARRAQRIRQAQITTYDLSDVLASSRENCFFCPENIELSTPKFPETLLPGGRIREGECHLFPNLFPFSPHHAVATITLNHYLELDQFTPEMIQNNLRASRRFVLSVHQREPQARFPLWIWNHMPPSAASIFHPHVQVVVDEAPTSHQRWLLEGSHEYYVKTGRNYWRDLVAEEKRLGDRYIGENHSLSAIASFAPQGNREVQIIFHQITNLAQLEEKHLADFADAIARVLKAYKEMGVGSFNLTTFSGPLDETADYYRLNAKLISRPLPQPYYTNDTGFMERFHSEWVIETLPEDVAEKMRSFF